MAIFCTSRYGFILVAFAVSLWVMYVLFKGKKSWDDFFERMIFYSLSLLIMLILIYQYSLRFQDLRLGFHLWYVEYLSDGVRVFFKPISLIFYVVVAIALVKRIKKRELSDFHVITLIVAFTFFIASIFGVYPWDKLRTVSALMLLMLFSILFVMVYAESKWQIGDKLYLHLLFFAFVNFFVLTNYHFRFNPESDGLNEFCEWRKTNSDVKLGVNFRFYPNIRYLFEYGDLKDKKTEWNYPDAYIYCGNEMNAEEYLFGDGDLTDVKEKYLLSASRVFVSLPSYTCIKVIRPKRTTSRQ